MLRGKISELIPIATLVQLAITDGKIAKGVQWGAVCIALDALRNHQVLRHCSKSGSPT